MTENAQMMRKKVPQLSPSRTDNRSTMAEKQAPLLNSSFIKPCKCRAILLLYIGLFQVHTQGHEKEGLEPEQAFQLYELFSRSNVALSGTQKVCVVFS